VPGCLLLLWPARLQGPPRAWLQLLKSRLGAGTAQIVRVARPNTAKMLEMTLQLRQSCRPLHVVAALPPETAKPLLAAAAAAGAETYQLILRTLGAGPANKPPTPTAVPVACRSNTCVWVEPTALEKLQPALQPAGRLQLA
jgi:hypothetical protein